MVACGRVVAGSEEVVWECCAEACDKDDGDCENLGVIWNRSLGMDGADEEYKTGAGVGAIELEGEGNGRGESDEGLRVTRVCNQRPKSASVNCSQWSTSLTAA